MICCNNMHNYMCVVIFGIGHVLRLAGIGAWQTVFEIMGYMAIMTNCSLIGLYAYKAELLPNTNHTHIILLVVALEVSHSITIPAKCFFELISVSTFSLTQLVVSHS